MAAITTAVADIADYFVSLYNFVEPFLTEECKKNFYQKVITFTINDLIPNKIQEFEASYRQWIVGDEVDNCLDDLAQAVVRFKGTYDLKTLKDEKYLEILSNFSAHFNALVDTRLKRFRKGEPFFTIHHIKRDCEVPTLSRLDFKGAKVGYVSHTALENFQKQETLRKKILKKVQKNEINSTIENLRGELSNIEDFPHQLIKWYVHLSKKLGKSFENLTREDLETHRDYFEDLLAQAKAQKEEKAKSAYDALLKEEELLFIKKKEIASKKATKRAEVSEKEKKLQKLLPNENEKGKTDTKIKETPVNPLGTLVTKLNHETFKTIYKLHERILRWALDIQKVKMFRDYDPLSQQYKYSYAHCTDTELYAAKRYHNLSGIENLLAWKQVVNSYCFPYWYKDRKTGELKTGQGMSATCQWGNEKKTGILYVGIGKDNVIYHAMFVPLSASEKQLLPSDLAKPLDHVEEKEETQNDKNLTSPYTFSLVEDNVIQMDIGKSIKERVIYRFYPLV